MSFSSPLVAFDNRLLTIEEQFRQRQHGQAIRELAKLKESEFAGNAYQHGLYLSLLADSHYCEGNYKPALECGLKAVRLLAEHPANKQFGRVQLVLSKTYSAVGDLKNAEIRARDALAAFRRDNDQAAQVDPYNELARLSFMQGKYESAVSFLEDALANASDDTRRVAQFTGNLGRIRIHTGQWTQAEKDLRFAIDYAQGNNRETSLAANLLSLGYLQIKRRQFILAGRTLDSALEIIGRLSLKREKLIYLEYAGELALAKGDLYRAKALLSDAYHKGMLIAPDSAVVSQPARRLAETELALDNVDEAMKYAQKALELARGLGELEEIAVSQRTIANVFAGTNQFVDALEYIRLALESARQLGDPYEIILTLLAMADIKIAANSDEREKIRAALDEAYRLAKKMKLDFLMAETDYRAGVFACQEGNLSTGFRKLSRSERLYARLDDQPKVRKVSKFLRTLAEQAVVLSVSEENTFKIFGNQITATEYSDFKSSSFEQVIESVRKRCTSYRAAICAPDHDGESVIATGAFKDSARAKFAESFTGMLGQEISKSKPTLMLDCRRDPFINELFPDDPTPVASVIVVPFQLSDKSTCYLYLDRQSHDNCLNPFSQADLNFAVGFSDLIAFRWAEMEKNKLAEDNLRLKQQLMEKSAFPNIITNSKEMLDILNQVRQVVNANISISIEGETGCGKDLVAKAIHYNSDRRNNRFISVNCAALPETLLESELFGYARGAFTGADRNKPGLFEEAHKGTFFLDEIGDMPLSVQAKILRVLESKEIVRLGETQPRLVDVRIVSATNKDLKEAMNAGQFRQDLYYRLSALTFRLPPLRDRKEDIPLLISHFLKDTDKTIDPELMKVMLDHDWPGNVRELDNEIKKLILLSGDEKSIGIELVSGRIQSSGNGNGSTSRRAESIGTDVEFSDQYTLYDYLATYEKQFIVRALKEKSGVKKHAAAVLNIPESTLRLKIKQYNIDLTQLG